MVFGPVTNSRRKYTFSNYLKIGKLPTNRVAESLIVKLPIVFFFFLVIPFKLPWIFVIYMDCLNALK